MQSQKELLVYLGQRNVKLIFDSLEGLEPEIDMLNQIKNQLSQNPIHAYGLILKHLYGTYDNYLSLAKEWSQVSGGLCAKSVTKKDQTYKCDDCGRETNFHVFCAECFEDGFKKGLHKGHRYKSKNERSGCCDCGDTGSVDTIGFCSKHNGVAKCDVKLDEEFEKKLIDIFTVCFKQIFKFCEDKIFYEPIILQVNKIQPSYQNKLKQQQALTGIQTIVSILACFITKECKQKLPILYSLSNFFISPIDQYRNHTCHQQSFLKTFSACTPHKCTQTIAALLFKHSLAFEHCEKDLSSMLYALFVNEQYKLKLSEIYLQNFKFLFIIQNYQSKVPYLKSTDMFLIYCQFFGDKYSNALINSPSFENVVDQMKRGIQKFNSKYYKFDDLWKSVRFLFHMFPRLKTVLELQKQETLALKLIGHIIEIAEVTNNGSGISFDHHKFKIFMIGVLLDAAQQLCGVIKYEEEYVEQKQTSIIQGYLMNCEIINTEYRKDETKEKGDTEIVFSWYCLPDLIVGALLTVYFSKFGKQKTKNLLKTVDTSGKMVKKMIARIVKSQIDAYKVGRSNQVGFPNEQTPKQIYKYFYKDPNRATFEGAITTLQVLGASIPDLVIQVIIDQKPFNSFQLIADIFMQETCYINVSTICQIQSKLFDNSLKLQLINILNLRNNSKFDVLKTTFMNQMFAKNVSFNKTLSEIAHQDTKKEIFTIKSEYEKIKEPILVKRCDSYSKLFFENKGSEVKLYNDSRLYEFQEEENLTTLCLMASKQLSNSKLFVEYFSKMIDYLWDCGSSIQDYEILVFITLVYKRTKENPIHNHILRKLLEEKPYTPLQCIISQILSKLPITQTSKQQLSSLQQKQLQSLQNLTIQPKPKAKINRMKGLVEKFKKQQNKFIQKNQQLVTTITQQQKLLSQNLEQQSPLCLICHQTKINEQHLYPGCVMYKKSTTVFGNKIDTFSSCGHAFHIKCLKGKYDFQRVCPVCKHPYDELFEILPPQFMQFLSQEQDLEIAFKNKHTFALSATAIEMKDPQNYYEAYFHSNEKSMLRLAVYKTYFSILDSCHKFSHSTIPQLRSLIVPIPICLGRWGQKHVLREKYEFKEDNEINPESRARNLIEILKFLYFIAMGNRPKEIKHNFDEVISTMYTKYFVCNFMCFLNNSIELETKEDIETQLKINQDAIKAQMNEFCKAMIFTYAVVFDDKRNNILKTITNEDNLTEVLSQIYPQFFTLDLELFITLVQSYKNNTEFSNKTYESLLPIPPVIDIKNNYYEFHQHYNDLQCHKCKGFIQAYKDQSWMCLLCGYKQCLINCGKPNYINKSPCAGMIEHFKSHGGECLFIDLNDSLVYTYDEKCHYYAFIFKDKFGQYDSDTIKDWKSLELQQGAWSKLLEELRKRTLHVFAVQNNYKEKKLQIQIMMEEDD